ncbi:hypothetical protein [Vibrio superstes]|uniref:Uncharacterized protein n=1 Tax=Vibrio superstes NBRC 103154 TaxID=1219062 RepID=A0A511QQF1_9VIBR|nr:hypothetical protein [Vibrio superstes]GEM79570.1 hypothetical protein VSU01S_18150 [Vibrio superstes NBRC 103154]
MYIPDVPRFNNSKSEVKLAQNALIKLHRKDFAGFDLWQGSEGEIYTTNPYSADGYKNRHVCNIMPNKYKNQRQQKLYIESKGKFEWISSSFR